MLFLVAGMGNCLYSSLKKGFGMCLAMEKEFPYYPNRYFRHQVAEWLVRNRQRVMLAKGSYLRQAYGIADPDATFPGPYSYREYCCNVLDHRFWGDAVILYAVSCMWALKITPRRISQLLVSVILVLKRPDHLLCSLSFPWSLV